jgi:hypothetical protein
MVASLAPVPSPRAGCGQRRPPWRASSGPGGSSRAIAAAFLEGPTGSTRARQKGLSGGLRGERPEEHAARQAHGRARLGSQKEGRAFTRLARRAWSKARARASSVSFGQAPAGVPAAPAVEPAPRRPLRARRSSPLRGPITRPYLRSGLTARRLHSTSFPVRAPAPGARTQSPASGAPGPTASSGAWPQALRGIQPLRARPVGASVSKASLSAPPRPRLRPSGPAWRGCGLAGPAMAAANWAVTPRARRVRGTRRAGPRWWLPAGRQPRFCRLQIDYTNGIVIGRCERAI